MNKRIISLFAAYWSLTTALGKNETDRYRVVDTPSFISNVLKDIDIEKELSQIKSPNQIEALLNRICPRNSKKEKGKITILYIQQPNRRRYLTYTVRPVETDYILSKSSNKNKVNKQSATMGVAGINTFDKANSKLTIDQGSILYKNYKIQYNDLAGMAASVKIRPLDEDGNYAGVSQIGAANTALFNGNKDTFTTNQINNTVSNTAFVFQGFIRQHVIGAHAPDVQLSKRTLEAVGSAAIINQKGDDTSTTIYYYYQTNDRDKNATITQISSDISNTEARIFTGNNDFNNNNTATGVARITHGPVNYTGIDVLQTNRNTASISQVAGSGLKAKVQQGGLDTTFNNAANISFGIVGLNGTPVALVGTVANNNVGTITQTLGETSNVNIFQNGRFNTATVTQANGNAHQALIVQTSNSQRASATISQTSTGTGNAATILQFAGSNADGQGQFGNIASISQVSGSNNVAFVQQDIQGSATSLNDNMATITQNGSSNFARFLQVGNNNMVNITQNGNNNQVLNLAGDLGSYGSQIGYNNHLTLVKEGENAGSVFKYILTSHQNSSVSLNR
jgi:hypothetical protein